MLTAGAKVQHEIDLRGNQYESLQIERNYRTVRVPSSAPTAGYVWSFSFERQLSVAAADTGRPPGSVSLLSGDGTQTDFRETGGRYTTDAPGHTLVPLTSTFDEWMHTNPSGKLDHFKKFGSRYLFINSTTKEGNSTLYSYDDAGKLDKISDAFGRVLTVKWNDEYSIESISGVDASLHYAYERFGLPDGLRLPGLQRLTHARVSDAGGAVLGEKQYHYGDDWATWFSLTGITDENNKRYATYSYDAGGRVLRSEHAGGADRYDFSYPSNGSRIVTDPLGSSRRFTLSKVGTQSRVTAIDQPGGAGCGPAASRLAYDPNGTLKSRTDFNNNKTCFTYDSARRLEIGRIDGFSGEAHCPAVGAALSNGQRKVTTQWHPDWQLATMLAEPLKITTHVYNGQKDLDGSVLDCASGGTLPDGRPLAVLCKRIEQATTDSNGGAGFNAVRTGNPRTTSYTYNRLGQILSVTTPGRAGSRGDTTTYAYYPDTSASHTAGDLWKVTAPKGRAKEFLEYTPDGLATKIKEFNGQTSTFSYDAQQHLTRRVTSAGTPDEQSIAFSYDAAGQLTRVDRPDTSFITYRYDDAHRLTDIADKLGNTIHYSLDAMGNRIKEETRDPGGALTRQIVRAYDALNRVQATSEGAL
jgi:YD repeat-containing protein